MTQLQWHEVLKPYHSQNGQKAKSRHSFTLPLPSRTPSIRFTGKGSILPSSNDMSLLFAAVN